MNILYISNLGNRVDSGLSWSVPASVNAQQKYDNVLWINLCPNASLEHWHEVDSYHPISDFGGKLKLSNLPCPFSSPDLVVFEGYYFIEQAKFALRLRRKKIPYIVIPRGSLTTKAIKYGGWKKQLKKRMANYLIFDKYVKNSIAVQYLTENEKKASDQYLQLQSFVLPNGISVPEKRKQSFSNGIKAVFIGRLDIESKGIDIVLKAIGEERSLLSENGFHLDIFGPPLYDVKKISNMITTMDLNGLVCNHERGISGEEKENVLLNSDVFVLTSRFEGHPMGLIEALSYGLPSLVTTGTNMAKEIEGFHAGWSSDVNVEGVANSLRRMIADKSLFHKISNNCINLSANYDWDNLAMRFHQIAKELVCCN